MFSLAFSPRTKSFFLSRDRCCSMRDRGKSSASSGCAGRHDGSGGEGTAVQKRKWVFKVSQTIRRNNERFHVLRKLPVPEPIKETNIGNVIPVMCCAKINVESASPGIAFATRAGRVVPLFFPRTSHSSPHQKSQWHGNDDFSRF